MSLSIDFVNFSPIHTKASSLLHHLIPVTDADMIAPDTTALSYWLNWRVLLCAIWVFTPMVASAFILWRYEGLNDLKYCRCQHEHEIDHLLYKERAWRPSLVQIHPIWLLVYRAIAFSVLLVSLIDKVYTSGFLMFYYYTQWTFTSVTIYFGFGLMLSIEGCYRYHKTNKTVFKGNDMEQGYNVALISEENTNLSEPPNSQEKIYGSEAASIATWVFQVLFQLNAGAVMLTDCLYWGIIFPFLTIKTTS